MVARVYICLVGCVCVCVCVCVNVLCAFRSFMIPVFAWAAHYMMNTHTHTILMVLLEGHGHFKDEDSDKKVGEFTFMEIIYL